MAFLFRSNAFSFSLVLLGNVMVVLRKQVAERRYAWIAFIFQLQNLLTGNSHDY